MTHGMKKTIRRSITTCSRSSSGIRVDETEVGVEVDNGVVTLTGTVNELG